MIFARALAASIFSACLWASGALAQHYPDRPVTLVVAFAPGGADDATARILQDPMQKALGQPIVVENVSGAGGMIAAAKVARAEPDGYTILLHQRVDDAGGFHVGHAACQCRYGTAHCGVAHPTQHAVSGPAHHGRGRDQGL